jgi:hypothetical protein
MHEASNAEADQNGKRREASKYTKALVSKLYKKGSQNSIRVVNFFCAGFVVPRKVRDDLMSEEQTNEL